MSANTTIIAITQDFLLEFSNTGVAFDSTELPLYVHTPEANVKQILGADIDFAKTGNSRLYSFYANYNNTSSNYLLDPTPFSFSELDAPVHIPSAQTITSKVPYRSVRFYVKAGYAMPVNSAGIALKISVGYDGNRVDLLNLFVPANIALFKPSERNLYIDNRLYSFYIDLKILDMSILSTTTDTQLNSLFEDIIQLGAGTFTNSLMTDYKAELSIIENSDVDVQSLSGANTASISYNFTSFIANQWATNTQFLVDTLTGLNGYVSRFGGFIEVGVIASGLLSIQQQLLLITSSLDNIDITHYVDIEEIDAGLAQIGTRRLRLSNDDLEWGVSQFIPILDVTTESIIINIRTRITAFDTGFDISKFSTLTLTGSDVDALRQKISNFTLDVTQLSVNNSVNNQQIVMSGGIGANRLITLTNSVVYVHWTNVILTSESTNDTFLSNDTPIINLTNTLTNFSFEFTKNSIIQELPTDKLYIQDANGAKVYEYSRDGQKVIFKLISTSFTSNHLELKSSLSGVILSMSSTNL